MAYGQRDHEGKDGWRARYKRPDGTWGSQSGFSSEKAAEEWGQDQEALIRRNMWIDPRDAETPFGTFAPECLAALAPRLEPGTVAKYQSYMDNHLMPQWSAWPMIGIFNSYVEIEKWLSELHEDYADSTVASVFAAFSSILNAAVKARLIPANPCYGIRVTSGTFDTERLVASPVQALRAAMRLYEAGLGLSGFALCLMDFYTGARWGELVGQQRHEYDAERRAICIRQPLKEVGGRLLKGGAPVADASANMPAQAVAASRRGRGKKGKTKTPAGLRWVELPPSVAVFYEELLDSHRNPFVFCTPEGAAWRRSNFRQRYWRPAWDGTKPDEPSADDHTPAILRWFTFHEGRHSHTTWLTEDGIPEVARRARLGQKMKGIARVYDHVTPVMLGQIIQALEARWLCSLSALSTAEQTTLASWFPHLRGTSAALHAQQAPKPIAISSPFDH